MRIITRPDFDGIACAVLLCDALNIDGSIKWAEPNAMQKGLIEVQKGDIIANLPFHPNCDLWFDHHYTNRIDRPYNGVFKITPSAARIIFDYYEKRFKRDYRSFIDAADKIDSAKLTLDEVLHPEHYPYVMLSMTIDVRSSEDESYWNTLVDLLQKYDIDDVCRDPQVADRFQEVIARNEVYKTRLQEHTILKDHVSITDFRSVDQTPKGNRFIVYSLFPDTGVNVKIHFDSEKKEKVAVHVGHSIFNDICRVNVGLMLSAFDGGGHRGAGGTRFRTEEADQYIERIIGILLKNEKNEPTFV
jgi:hypothetical protein